MTRLKVFVKVLAFFDPEGRITPMEIIWEDGRRFEIDRILDVRPAASLKAGGAGLRYTVRISNKTTCLFYETGRWFVEGKQAVQSVWIV